jgi:Flp pilus assembly protein TadD
MASRRKHRPSAARTAAIATPSPVPSPKSKRGLLAGLAVGLLLGAVIGGAVGVAYFVKNRRVIDLGVTQVPARTAGLDDQAVFAAYAGSASCRECHPKEFEAWRPSHHGQAERAVDPKLDRAAFDPPREFAHGSQKTAVRTNAAGRPEVTTVGRDGKLAPFAVERVIGVEPLRQFLVPTTGGRLQTLEASYDPHKDQWFDVYGDEDRQPGDWGHWTGRGMNWNAMCAACHNTRVRKNYDEQSDSYQTSMAEPTVSCESCHGPMKRHVVEQRAAPHAGLGASATTRIGTPSAYRFTKDQTFQTCASCHARRADLTGDFAPGDSFHDHYSLSIPDLTENFYPDGQVKEEDYEFTAFMGSKMHAAGVRCADCHDPHTAKTILAGNNLCMRCHNGSFQGSPLIVPEQHSFHKPESAGNQCVNCHMPQTTFMQRHARHDHGFTIPDPLLTKKHGTPNACNRCHTDKDTDWAVAAVDQRYGAKMNRPSRERARAVAKARRGDGAAREPLLAMLKEDKLPFWRAVAAATIGQWADGPDVLAALKEAADHVDPLVREQATVALGAQAPRGDADVLAAIRKRLDDPARTVRIRAARILAAEVDPASHAGQDLAAMLKFNADQPAGAMEQGQYAAARNDLNAAATYFAKAVDWSPNEAPPRDALANALILLKRPAKAAEQLGIAAQLDPREPMYPYKQALALERAGELVQAVAVLRAAELLHPTVPALPLVRASLHLKLGQAEFAKGAARRTLQIDPKSADAAQLLKDLGG